MAQRQQRGTRVYSKKVRRYGLFNIAHTLPKEDKMEQLEYIKNERLRIQQEYLKHSKNIWIEFEGVEADKKHKKVYNDYKNKDYFLENVQSRLESALTDVEYYKEKYK